MLSYILTLCYNVIQVNHMETTATTKGQVVIPASVRKIFGIKAGTRIRVELDRDAGEIILKPITREYVNSLRGRYRGSGLLKELQDERKREKKY